MSDSTPRTQPIPAPLRSGAACPHPDDLDPSDGDRLAARIFADRHRILVRGAPDDLMDWPDYPKA